MKKFISGVLAILMVVSLTACGGESSSSSTDATKPSSVEDSSTISQEESSNPTEVSFEEITVVDNEQCTIKITEIDKGNIWGYTLKTYLENKSADKTYMYSVTSAAINGVQTDPLFATEVAAGKKSNSDISFSSDLKQYGITDFTDIELSFKVYDSNDWMADAVFEGTVHVYPYGEENSSAFVREAKDTDTVIVDNDSATVIVTDYDPNSIWGYTANLYLVNKTDKELMFSVDEASINGFMSDPFWATSVDGNKVAFSSLSWSSSDLESNGITSVEEIEMKLKIYDANDWSASAVFENTVTLKP